MIRIRISRRRAGAWLTWGTSASVLLAVLFALFEPPPRAAGSFTMAGSDSALPGQSPTAPPDPFSADVPAAIAFDRDLLDAVIDESADPQPLGFGPREDLADEPSAPVAAGQPVSVFALLGSAMLGSLGTLGVVLGSGWWPRRDGP